MPRLFIHVEGETEEMFVNQILRPHFINAGYLNVSAKLLGNARARARRGGIRNWPSVRDDILRHLKDDQNILSTVMVDYYALPSNGGNAWPGRDASVNLSTKEKGKMVEDAILSDIAARMGVDAKVCRFIPFVMMHEFEALLFSDCKAFSDGIGMPHIETQLSNIRSAFLSPEDINDSPQTAPSKRVEALIPGYQKPLYGNVAALAIGLDVIRAECQNFADWLTRLEEKIEVLT
jgi:Domain of unknown function (DUF4276)